MKMGIDGCWFRTWSNGISSVEYLLPTSRELVHYLGKQALRLRRAWNWFINGSNDGLWH